MLTCLAGPITIVLSGLSYLDCSVRSRGGPMRVRTLAVFAICFVLGCIAADGQTAAAGPSAPELFEKGMNALAGSSVTRSDLNAIEYFHRSAEIGFAPAQVVLGYLFETGRATDRKSTRLNSS